MKMEGVDWKETEKQAKASKNKALKEEAKLKVEVKLKKQEAEQLEREDEHT